MDAQILDEDRVAHAECPLQGGGKLAISVGNEICHSWSSSFEASGSRNDRIGIADLIKFRAEIVHAIKSRQHLSHSELDGE